MKKENYIKSCRRQLHLSPTAVSQHHSWLLPANHTHGCGWHRAATNPCSELARSGWRQSCPSSLSRISAKLAGVVPDLARCRWQRGQAARQQLSEELGMFGWDGLTGVNTMQNLCSSLGIECLRVSSVSFSITKQWPYARGAPLRMGSVCTTSHFAGGLWGCALAYSQLFSLFCILQGNVLECDFMSRRNRARANTKV